ncbi:uncharacterized protein ARMOST_11778 [Armillaria ostoyae]|uniref:Uncharacterized protein n=1 Tax=Armillaria ostoyae TaxID=47428 RepID=A0A284RI35_ARMOS|nr:uncharacterized protein ARMOST_11778 [Armillaria ostoyae]
MNITCDITSQTTIALAATIIDITTFITTFLIYRVYRYEIRQYIHHLFLVTPCQPAPCYPTVSFTVPFHYVPYAHSGPIRPPLPPLFPSQSSGLSTSAYASDSSCIYMEQEELDLREEGRRALYSEYQEIPAISTAGLSRRLEESPAVPTTEPFESATSSSKFPTHHSTPRPVIIITDNETDNENDYAPHSPTDSEYAVWLEDNHLALHTEDWLPHSTPWSPSWSPPCSESPVLPQFPKPQELFANLRGAAAAVEDTAVREYSAQAELNRIIARDELIAAYYRRASCP